MVIIGDLMLLLALFLSANMALAWGELGSFPVPGDKSALAGLGGAFFRSDPGPQRTAWAFAFLLPLPALAAAAWGLNRGWVSRHRLTAFVLVALAVWAHVAAWRQGYRRG